MRYTVYGLEAQFDTTFYPLPFTTSLSVKNGLTGNVGAVYRPADKTILQVNLSTGFRAPNVDDMGKIFDSAPGNVTVPNPGLRSEYAWNAEMGMTQLIGNWLRLEFSAYTTYLQRGMVKRPFQLNGQDSIYYDGILSRVEAVQNAAFVKVRGIQAGMEFQITSSFTGSSQYNIQRGTEELEDGSISSARQAAPNFGISQLTWKHKKGNVTLMCQYSDGITAQQLALEEQAKPELYAKDTEGRPYSPAWLIWNVNASWEIARRTKIHIGAENLADMRYRPYSSGLAGAGRQIVVALRTGW